MGHGSISKLIPLPGKVRENIVLKQQDGPEECGADEKKSWIGCDFWYRRGGRKNQKLLGLILCQRTQIKERLF